MLISCSILGSALKYQQNVKKRGEHFSWRNVQKGSSAALGMFFLIIGVLFLALELLLLWFSIKMAISCSKPGGERICHIVLAIMFTMPYCLIMMIFSDCGKKALRR